MLKVKINRIKLKQTITNKTLLNKINFELYPNMVYTILGKNGAGKTSLINSILLLLNKRDYQSDCSVIFNGVDLYKISEEELRTLRKEKIKYVFQDAQKSFDQLKNIGYYFNSLDYDNNKLDELLDFFKLPKRNKLFLLYPYELSVGMAQRISFILALAAEPKLIILDEPTSSVDSVIANLFLIKIKEFVKKKDNSILIITQDLLFAEKVSDEIAYLSNGSLTEFIPPEKFFSEDQSGELNELVEFYKSIKE
ncbi:MAG: ABC transporter ATP-binding protein [Ignavibacteriae bacterium]|nr:ABC transporter ATP-binding protein [Ignavibacteriota bacterium]